MGNLVEYILSLKSGQFESGVASAGAALDGLDNKVSSLGTALGLTFGIAGVSMFAKSIVDAGTSVENALTGLTTLLGNSRDAQRVITNTMEDATKTPFAFEGLLAANKALISADENATQAREAVLNLANAIAATGGGDAELERMVVNLQQIKNVGFASALDIKQFAYAGVNIYKVLDEAAIAHGENQKITYEQITSALKKAHDEGGIYFNGLENMAGNTSVQISNLGDQVFQLKNHMFEDLKPTIEDVIEASSKFITKLQEGWDWATRHVSIIKAMVVGYGSYKLALMLAVPIMKSLEVATIATTTATSALSVAQLGLLGPLGLVAVAIGAIASAYSYANDKSNEYYANSREQKALNEFALQNKDGALAMGMMGDLNNVKDYLSKKGVKGDALYDQMYNAKKLDLDLQRKSLSARLEQAGSLKDELEIQKKLQELDDSERVLSNLRSEKFANMQGKALMSSSSAASKKSGAATRSASMGRSDTAVGKKSITFNISINDIVKSFVVNTNTIKDSSSRIRNVVTDALMSSINDFQRAIPE